jgi:hypothetical protein
LAGLSGLRSAYQRAHLEGLSGIRLGAAALRARQLGSAAKCVHILRQGFARDGNHWRPWGPSIPVGLSIGTRDPTNDSRPLGLENTIRCKIGALGNKESLRFELAGGRSDGIIQEQARNAAEAEMDRPAPGQAGQIGFDRASEFGSLEIPQFFSTDLRAVRWLISMDNWFERGGRGRRPNRPIPEDYLGSMPSNKQDRALEAMQRVIPELVKLERHEKRAAGRRNQAIRQMAGLKEPRG